MAHLKLKRPGEEKLTIQSGIDGVFIDRDNVQARGPLPGKIFIPVAVLDSITRDKHTAVSFDELINSPGNYRPTLDVRDEATLMLADAYDAAQASRGDSRRAFRRT
ncbi:MAG TPA: hypothetical protein PK416_03105 [Thermodesulfobacteriota bacterium]|nr:hypothetical protein [Thermodesulfobacteriota bacterium]